MADEAPETLRRLEERLSRASEAAERLVAEAARSAARPRSTHGDRPPPAGWQVPRVEEEEDEAPRERQAGELEVLVGAIHLLRELVPPDVVERLAAALRELLLAVRALIDFYLERLERPKQDRSEARDIPID
jgi:hypothetical protein